MTNAPPAVPKQQVVSHRPSAESLVPSLVSSCSSASNSTVTSDFSSQESNSSLPPIASLYLSIARLDAPAIHVPDYDMPRKSVRRSLPPLPRPVVNITGCDMFTTSPKGIPPPLPEKNWEAYDY